jgi:hypothetical protein
MAKAIKFNLILDDKPVRSLDDLRDNFNIEDLLGAYRNGSLKRWLESREAAKEIAELEKVSGDDINAAMELCRIFYPECTKQQIETAVYPFEFREKEAEKLRQFKNLKEEKAAVIKAYHGGYEKLLDELEKKGEEYPFVKAAVQEIFENYLDLFNMNVSAFYTRYIFDFPLVILGLLANANIRPLVFSSNNLSSRKDHVFADDMENVFLDITMPQRAMTSFLERYRASIPQPHLHQCTSQDDFNTLCEKLKNLAVLQGNSSGAKISVLEGASSEATQKIKAVDKLTIPFTYIGRDPLHYPVHVKSFAGQTESYWKDVEPKG